MKKVDYAAMFSRDGKTGLYYSTRTINGVKKKFRSKDPEALYKKIQEAENAAPYVPSFKEIAEEWKEYKWPQIEYKTQGCYASPLKRAIEEFDGMRIDEVTPAHVARLLERMKDKGYSSKSIKTQKTVLKMVFGYAIVHDPPYILINPASAVEVQRGLPKKKREAPEDDVMQIIIDNVDTAYFGLFPYLLLETGCRPCEARALTWGDIDFENDIIDVSKEYVFHNGLPHYKTTKTEAGIRKVHMTPGLKLHLVRPEDADDSQLLFPSEDGKTPLQENAYNRRWRHYCKDVGLVQDIPEERTNKNGRRYIYHHIVPTLTPYQLRHGHSTLIYESGIDEKSHQVEMGHSDIRITLQEYTDLRKKHRKEQMEKIDAYMSERYGEVTKVDTKPASA